MHNFSFSRILIFTTGQNIDLLKLSDYIYSDGTFSDIPQHLVAQLYTIHGKLHETIVPLVYMLLPRKDRATYMRAFRALQQIEPQFQPAKWMVDYEQAAIQAIAEVFPNCEISGCFFHYCQSLWRRIQHDGLTNAYREEDGVLKMQAKSFAALALIPLEVKNVANQQNIKFF